MYLRKRLTNSWTPHGDVRNEVAKLFVVIPPMADYVVNKNTGGGLNFQQSSDRLKSGFAEIKDILDFVSIVHVFVSSFPLSYFSLC